MEPHRTCPIDKVSTFNQLEERKWMWIPVIDGKAEISRALVQLETDSGQSFQGPAGQPDNLPNGTPAIFKSIAESLIKSYLGDSNKSNSPIENNNANPAKADIKG